MRGDLQSVPRSAERQDPIVYDVVAREEWVFVTNNDSDFLALTEQKGLHCGLILLPQRRRVEQPATLEAVLDYIERSSEQASLPAAAWMINQVVEYHDEDDTISTGEWPER